MPLHLGLDVGTQATKALLYDSQQRRVVGRGACPTPLLRSERPGCAEQHPQQWKEVRLGRGKACGKVKAATGGGHVAFRMWEIACDALPVHAALEWLTTCKTQMPASADRVLSRRNRRRQGDTGAGVAHPSHAETSQSCLSPRQTWRRPCFPLHLSQAQAVHVDVSSCLPISPCDIGTRSPTGCGQVSMYPCSAPRTVNTQSSPW